MPTMQGDEREGGAEPRVEHALGVRVFNVVVSCKYEVSTLTAARPNAVREENIKPKTPNAIERAVRV